MRLVQTKAVHGQYYCRKKGSWNFLSVIWMTKFVLGRKLLKGQVHRQERLLVFLIGRLLDLAHLRILILEASLQTDLDPVAQEMCGCILVMTEDHIKVAGTGEGF